MSSSIGSCRKVYEGCQHECGCLLFLNEVHICHPVCSRWVLCLDPDGEQVYRKCTRVKNSARLVDFQGGEQMPTSQLAHGESLIGANTMLQATPQRMTSAAPAESFPILHLKSPTPKVTETGRADTLDPQLSCLGRAQALFEGVELDSDSPEPSLEFLVFGDDNEPQQASNASPLKNDDPFDMILREFPHLFHDALPVDEGIRLAEDFAWKVGLAKCSSGHFYPGDKEACDICGEVNQFLFFD